MSPSLGICWVGGGGVVAVGEREIRVDMAIEKNVIKWMQC